MILVFLPYCPGSIGEQVVQVPFFRLLRKLHVTDPIVGIAPGPSGQVLERLGLLDEHLVYPIENGVGSLAGIVRRLRSRRCRAAFQHRRKSVRTALAARLATSAPIVGFRGGVNFLFQQRSVEFDRERYIGESYVALLGRRLDDAIAPAVDSDDYVLLVPGGLTEIKRYPIEKYLAIARSLRRPVRFLLGPDMTAERDRIRAEAGDLRVHFAPDFTELERIVARAALVVANDCGPAHFAHIHDVPRISLFDRSIDHLHWFRSGRRGRLLRSSQAGSIGEIPVDDVLSVADELLEGAGRASGPA